MARPNYEDSVAGGPYFDGTDSENKPVSDTWTGEGATSAYNRGWRDARRYFTGTDEPDPPEHSWDHATEKAHLLAEAEKAKAVHHDTITMAEEPVEHRIARAFTNGWQEGFERAIRANEGFWLDHA